VSQKKTIAIVGGAGALGYGLTLRWARAGFPVLIGSRDESRAANAAREANDLLARDTVRGASNVAAAMAAEIVVLAIPFSHHAPTLAALHGAMQGKIVIDVTVPLRPPQVRTVQLPEGGSIAKVTQATLGEGARVVSAFQNVSAAHLKNLDHAIDCDVLVCGNDADAREQVIALAQAAGMTGWHAGRIDNSAIAEALTSGLIFINGKYNIDGAGIRITGRPRAGSV
jgi:8-hydroxy-5-deazaflavin:NADPH oxidoreductase